MAEVIAVEIEKGLMTETEFKQHLDAIEKGPREIALAVAGLSDKVLRAKPSAGKWCILEILGHLADIEIVYGFRLRQMLSGKDSAGNEPAIAPIDQDAWARNLGYMDAPANEFVAGYGLNRHHNLRLLKRLKVDELEKGAFHPELGRKFTIAELVERMSGHGAGHLKQIEKLKSAK